MIPVMTPQEGDLFLQIIKCWNLFLELPVEHPDAVAEFRHSIHDLQRQVIARPMIRALNRCDQVTED